jgi:hypothetical protein
LFVGPFTSLSLGADAPVGLIMKLSKLLVRVNGLRALRISSLLLVTAVSSFMLGALFASLPGNTKVDPSVEALKSDKIPFFLRDSLSAVRKAKGPRSQPSAGTGPGHVSVAVQETTVSVTTTQGQDSRKYCKAFIGIFTTADAPGKTYDKRRTAIRDTWLPKVAKIPEFEARFIAGRSDDEEAQEKLHSEHKLTNDFVFLDMKECYTCLPQKTVAFLEMVSRSYWADWVIKMDDDVYLSPHRLQLAMEQWSKMNADYVGCMKHGLVHGDPASKWFEPAQILVGREYHLNAYGSIYVINGRAIDDVIIPNKDRLRQLANEDTSVGLWMSAFKVRFFEDMRLCQPFCHPAGIAFLDNMCSGLCNPLQDMYNYHKNLHCRRQAKAPLSYMPSYRGHEAFHSMRV